MTVELLSVAEYWHVSPAEVGDWPISKFLDAQEWVWLRTRKPDTDE